MNKVVVLRDQRVVEIRPIAASDVDKSAEFFMSLDREERKYFRRDVTSREVVEGRVNEAVRGDVDRIAAIIYNDRIVAEGTLERERYEWADGVAQIRIVVAPDFPRTGLGLRMVRELYVFAHQRDVGRIVARMMAPQVGARAIFRKPGFHDEFVIPKHVKDRDGNWQDLVIMRCDLTVFSDSASDENDASEPR